MCSCIRSICLTSHALTHLYILGFSCSLYMFMMLEACHGMFGLNMKCVALTVRLRGHSKEFITFWSMRKTRLQCEVKPPWATFFSWNAFYSHRFILILPPFSDHPSWTPSRSDQFLFRKWNKLHLFQVPWWRFY